MNSKCTRLLFIIVIICVTSEVTSHSHSHSHLDDVHEDESPAFKYSKAANQQFKKEEKDSEYDLYVKALSSTLLISIAPFLLLFFIPIDGTVEKQPLLKILLSFASGGLLGDAFLHLIPHALMSTNTGDEHGHGHTHSHSHSDGEHHEPHDTTVGLGVLGGIITFLIVEKTVRLFDVGHSHSHGGDKKKTDDKTKKKGTDKKSEIRIAGYLNLAADFMHNFTDGLAIGASYIAGQNIGLVTTITILLHEIPHEIGDFAILVQSGCSRRKAMFLQLLTAVGALSGTVISIYLQGTGNGLISSLILPFTAGGFIYIATVSVIPELLEGSNKFSQSLKEILALACGVYMMVLIAQYE